MSGIEAFGLAAAILQFVTLGGKLLVTGYEVYKSHDGATANTIHLQTVCAEVSSLTKTLSPPLPGDGRLLGLSGNEQALRDLANRAHNLAIDLSGLLESLKMKKKTFKSWGAIRQSWRLLSRKETIAGLSAQLSEIKSLLDTQLLILVRYVFASYFHEHRQ